MTLCSTLLDVSMNSHGLTRFGYLAVYCCLTSYLLYVFYYNIYGRWRLCCKRSKKKCKKNLQESRFCSYNNINTC